ncbi:unnamed protein product [Hermetia illucens]|uniref:Uncharacterized protein n=1 Tax=Hermetia illucens TaxID=343691 RepID=A0A7R8YVW3_HERIL|nr:unnamed protein product [Hermetia illucens]
MEQKNSLLIGSFLIIAIGRVSLANRRDDHYCRSSNFVQNMASKRAPVYGQRRIPPSWITFKQEFERMRKEDIVYVNLTSRFTTRKCCEGYKEVGTLYGFPKCVSVCVNGEWNPTAKVCDCKRYYGGKFCDKDCRLGECVERPLDYYKVEEVDKEDIRRHLLPNKAKTSKKITGLPKSEDIALTFDNKLGYQNRTLIGIFFAVASLLLYLFGVAMIWMSAEKRNQQPVNRKVQC